MAGRLQFTKDEAQAAATIPNKQKALQKKQMLTRPAASAVHAAEVSAHVEISQYEQDNVGVEAANRGAETAEVSARVIDRHAEQKKLTRKKQSEALSEDGPKKKAEARGEDRPNKQPGRRDGRPQRESSSVKSENRREGRQSAMRHTHGDGDHSESRRDSFHPGDAKHQNHAHEGRGSARSVPRQQSASSASRNAVQKKQRAKLQQKRSIKKEYAAAKRNGKSATESFSTVTSRVRESLSETGKKAVQFVKKHKAGAILGIGVFMVVAIGINLMGGGAALSSGTTAVVESTTYPSADEDILAAEEQYLGMLIALRSLKNGSGPMAGAVPIESATAIAGGNEADIAADEPTVAAKADDVEAAATEDEMTSVTVGRRRGEIEEPTVGVFGAGPYAVRQNQVQDSPSAGQQAGNHSHSKPAQQARNQSGSTLAIPAPKKTEEKRKKRGAATWIAIAAGLVVVISCVLLLTLGRGKNGGNEGNTEPALNSRPSEQSSTETPATELPATDTEPTPVELTGITVSRKPDKTSYDVGDYLDTSGLTLIVNYSDGTKETIREGFDYYPNLLNEAGQQEITVSYGGESTVFTVKVSAVIELTGMSIWSLPDKLSYNVGDQLNTSGLKIELTYSDGSQEVVSSGFECLPSTLTDAGSQTVYVNYDDYGATFVVEVSDPINYFDDNIAAYFALGDFKCFGMRYENPVLDNILSSYHYTSDIYDRDNTYFKINCFDVIPGYVGVSTLDDLTETLISALLAYGHGDDGLDKALWDNGWNIRCGFESIWGTVMEVEHEPTTGENCGYDFELTNGKYTATFITKPGGW